MGFGHVEAANLFTRGRPVVQSYERFPVHAAVSTFAHSSVGGAYSARRAWDSFGYMKLEPTDSAAAATAMATGVKTRYGRIGLDADGDPRVTVLEYAEARGKATGVVSTVEFSSATSASFVAHDVDRDNYQDIANEMLKESATDVIMGTGNPYFTDYGDPRTPSSRSFQRVGGQDAWERLAAGTLGGDADGDGDADPFTLVQSLEEFEALATGPAPARVCGVPQVYTTLQQARSGDTSADAFAVPMNANVPSLARMTQGALNVLDADEDGFVLVIEGGAIDWASHYNQPGRLIEEQQDLNAAADAVVRWVETSSGWDETLVILTADHETGYLTGPASGQYRFGPVWNRLVNNGRGVMPGMAFNTGGHTNSLVPLYANGPGAYALRAAVKGIDPVRGPYVDNTDIAKTMFAVIR